MYIKQNPIAVRAGLVAHPRAVLNLSVRFYFSEMWSLFGRTLKEKKTMEAPMKSRQNNTELHLTLGEISLFKIDIVPCYLFGSSIGLCVPHVEVLF